MPAEMPAVVTTRPLSTKRRPLWTLAFGYCRCSSSIAPKKVVTSSPSSSPALARTKAPVQTDCAISASRAAFSAHAKNTGSACTFAAGPPGKTTMSGRGAFSME
jgi:hypothetical protein